MDDENAPSRYYLRKRNETSYGEESSPSPTNKKECHEENLIVDVDGTSSGIRVRENIPILAQVMPDHEYALNICTRGIPEKKIPEPVQNPGVSSSSDSSFKSNEKHSIDDEDIQLKILNLETASKLKKATIQLERNKRKNEMKNEINKRKNEMKYKMKLDKIKMKAEWKKIDIETEIEKKKLLSRAHK